MNEKSVHKDAEHFISISEKESIETVWSRLKSQEPHCGYCELGLSCRNCAMGPCRIDPFGDGPQKGVCGASRDTIVARNLLLTISAGAAAHSDHGRDILETFYETSNEKTSGYMIKDVEKLKKLAIEFGINVNDRNDGNIARELGAKLMEEFGTKQKRLTLLDRAPKKRQEIWERLNIVPRGIDRENVESLHRIHMGVDNDYLNLLLHSLRTSLSDGWGGSMIATELSDMLFGRPEPLVSSVNIGVLKENEVNIALHGHNPILSDVIVQAAEDPELIKIAKEKGAKGINLVGICCTGNELLMRKGVPMVGNHLMQELVIMSGVLDAMIVDYQCIMPSVVDVAKCFHTKIISTFDKAKFEGAEHISFDKSRGIEIGKKIVRLAVENFENRIPGKVDIPDKPVEMMAGFSVESILELLGGSLDPLINAIKIGKIRGVAADVGCNNPKIKHDYGHTYITKCLIENDILVLVTGCAAVANGKIGYMNMDAVKYAGKGLKDVCESLKIPPVLHVGSCVDNSRLLVLVSAIANNLGVDISDLPVVGTAPEWYSQKAVSIATYFVASGVDVVLGIPPAIFGSQKVVDVLTNGLKDLVKATFSVEPSPDKAARLIQKKIEDKRKSLGLSYREIG